MEVFRRNDRNQWVLSEYDLEERLLLESIGVEIAISDLYRQVQFEPNNLIWYCSKYVGWVEEWNTTILTSKLWMLDFLFQRRYANAIALPNLQLTPKI